MSKTHAIGRSKSRFLRARGFDESQTYLLEAGLKRIAMTEQVVGAETSEHGVKYVIDGDLETPDGDSVQMRTVWIIETGNEIPRLVTAYPR